MEILKSILNILLYLILGADLDTPYLIVTGLLSIAGMWRIFQKCHLPGWHILVPCLREASMGRAAGREQEGRFLAMTYIFTLLYGIISNYVAPTVRLGAFGVVLEVLFFTIAMVQVLYHVRIGLGFCEVFDQKKIWIIPWVLTLDWINALVWGFSKKIQPLWTVDDKPIGAAEFFSGSKAAVLDQGLTVNLEERTVTESFKKRYLLRDIHMVVQPGHMVLLLGGSGAGKTTFINAVNGYEKAKAEVMLSGRNMYKEYKDMMYDIGFVPQQDLMRGSDSVYRTLMDAANLRLPVELTNEDRKARVEEVMKIFGLAPVQDSLVDKLSGGQRKRLSIAMEYIANPTLFILDEPDSGLDGVMARELFEHLRSIADQGKIIIVITHTPDRVIDLFDDVIVLAKDSARTGRLAYFGPITEARTFFGKQTMEEIVKTINREEEGGEGRADEFIMKYAEVQHV